MCRLFLIFLCALIGMGTVSAQQKRTISGIVTDEMTGQTLSGVTISVAGRQQRTKTDAKGKYMLELEPADRSLAFSLVGYETQTQTLQENQTLLNVLLKEKK